MITSDITTDAITQAWIRDPGDEAAVRAGCRFDPERAAWAVWWIENYCRLYEGEQAGEPVLLHGCHECDYELPTLFDWDGEYDGWTGREIAIERVMRHAECVAAGHRIDWQYDCTARVFGWVQWSDHWHREVRRFIRSKIYIAKKNKKSPTMSAWSFYLTCGDGEHGQHVYLGAKDGEQVRQNTAKHMVNMLEQSPDLLSECKLNRNTLQISHLPTRSDCTPLSSSNVRTQKSKEGLNGSLMIDETHVVDQAFIDRTDRAGISRAEPLHAEFSTAGDDPDSYGKKQFDFCERILSGEKTDIKTFAAVYAAPQELTDADLDADPLRYGMMANPAMGHTINPEEFLADYNKSKSVASDLIVFKKYRLNIWQNSASPWLRVAGWAAGTRPITYESLRGRACWSALDLASVTDFAAFTLCFPEEDERFQFLWWFWLPEETAKQVQHLIPLRDWEKDPRTRLRITPGARLYFADVRATIREIHRDYDIRELAYDDWNAEQTTQELTEGVADASGRVIEPATGIVRVNFSQGIRSMNEPSKMFEGAVIDGKIEHTGDPVAAWMARNVTVKPDANGNIKPIKSRDMQKKIDGIVTAIMARARAAMMDSSSWQFEKGSLAL